MATDQPKLHWVHDLQAPDGPCTVVIAGLGRVDVTACDIRRTMAFHGEAVFTVKAYGKDTSKDRYYLDAVEKI